MTARKFAKVGGVLGACAALGAAGAYAGDATSSPSASSAATNKSGQAAGPRRGPLRALRRAVHADAVVPTKDGRFATVTLDRGVVEKVDGNAVTLKEGTRKATYRTVTLEIPSNAVVRIRRQPGKLSDVTQGQRAIVVHGPKRTLVAVRG